VRRSGAPKLTSVAPGAAAPSTSSGEPKNSPLWPWRCVAGSGIVEFLAVTARNCYRTITLTNDAAEARLFKVLTTAPTRYRVKPASGTLEAGASVEVHLVLTPQDEIPDDLSEWSKDKFQIKSLALSHAGGEEASAQAILDAWKAAPADAVEATRLRCSHAHALPEQADAAAEATSMAPAPAPQPTPASPETKASASAKSATPVSAKPASPAAAPAAAPAARDAGDESARWLATKPAVKLVGSLLVKLPSKLRERMLLPIVCTLALLLVYYADRLAAWMVSGSFTGLLGLLALCATYAHWLLDTPQQRAARPAGKQVGMSPAKAAAAASAAKRSKKAW